MAISINSAADARYYASRMNSSRTNSSSAAKKSTSSIVSSAARAVAAATSVVKSVVKKNSSSATTTAKKNNTNAAVNAASASVKSKTNQNKKTTTTVSSAASKVASSISKAVKTATNAVKTAAQNTKTATNAKAAAASTTKTVSKNTTKSKKTTNAKVAAVNNSNTKKTTSSNNNNLASRIVNTVSTAASTVKKATSNVNTSAAAERALQEAMSKAASARAEAEAKARAAAATKSTAKTTTSSLTIGATATATIKNTALSNKNTGKTTNTTVNPNVVKSASTVKKDTTIITNNISTPKYKSNPQPEPIGIIKSTKISDKDRVTNAIPILAANNAKIPVDSRGTPIINNEGDANRYNMEFNKLKHIEEQIKKAQQAILDSQNSTKLSPIDLSFNKADRIKCQHDTWNGGDGWEGCYSESIDAMWRINHSDIINANETHIIKNDMSSGSIDGTGSYCYKAKVNIDNETYTGIIYPGEDSNNNTYDAFRITGLSKETANKIMNYELENGRAFCYRVYNSEALSQDNAHTILCTGRLSDGTYTYSNCATSQTNYQTNKPLSDQYNGKKYYERDSDIEIIIDATNLDKEKIKTEDDD